MAGQARGGHIGERTDMTVAELGLALAVLLLTPGPTNTLMLMAGAERGWAGAARLIPVEVAAYLAVIAPLALLAQGFAAPLAVARPVVAVLAGIWVLYLAWTMWDHAPQPGMAGTVTARRLAVTTALNPKGLIMGLVLLPAAGATPVAFGVLVMCIVAVAGIWAWIGTGLPGTRHGAALPPLWRRAASVWLAGLAVFIVAGGIAA